eukprot:UN33459
MLQMSLILSWQSNKPIVRVMRLAGQYAKPRSSPYETVNGKKVMSYKGDNVNSMNPNNRTADPMRLISGYFHSATTLNYIRSLSKNGGSSCLKFSDDWKLSYDLTKSDRKK